MICACFWRRPSPGCCSLYSGITHALCGCVKGAVACFDCVLQAGGSPVCGCCQSMQPMQDQLPHGNALHGRAGISMIR